MSAAEKRMFPDITNTVGARDKRNIKQHIAQYRGERARRQGTVKALIPLAAEAVPVPHTPSGVERFDLETTTEQPVSTGSSLLQSVLTQLPAPVIVNIFSLLPGSSQMPSAYVADILNKLLRSERRCMPNVQYMVEHNGINRYKRADLVVWVSAIHKKYKWGRDVLFLAVSIMDRYLSRRRVLGDLRVVGTSALLIACKTDENFDKQPATLELVRDCVQTFGLPHDSFYGTSQLRTNSDISVSAILTMEVSILTAIDFDVIAATPAHFLPHFTLANHARVLLGRDPACGTDALLSVMSALTEMKSDRMELEEQLSWRNLKLALRDLDIMRFAPSKVAAAAVIVTNQLHGHFPVWPQMMAQVSGHTESSLAECLQALEMLLQREHAAAAFASARRLAPWPRQEASEATRLRLECEFQEMQAHSLDRCFAGPVDGDVLQWQATVIGPELSPYHDGMFSIRIDFPYDYPSHPPCMHFDTKIYHCNVGRDGAIGSNILCRAWTPSIRVAEMLLAVVSMLRRPNSLEPLDLEIAQVFHNDRQKHDRIAREWTRLYSLTDPAIA